MGRCDRPNRRIDVPICPDLLSRKRETLATAPRLGTYPPFGVIAVMERTQTYDEPSSVSAKDGDVHVDGPDSVDVALTTEAAVESGERLIEQGAGQRYLRDSPHRAKDSDGA
jgi:hypothetical protein